MITIIMMSERNGFAVRPLPRSLSVPIERWFGRSASDVQWCAVMAVPKRMSAPFRHWIGPQPSNIFGDNL